MKSNNIAIRRLAAALTLTACAALGSAAQATTLNLSAYNIADASGLDLSVDVTADGSTASFAFANDSTGDAAGSSLARIYFESGLSVLGLSNGATAGGSGVSFSTSYPGPGAPPAGNTVNWSGNLAAFGAVASPPQNGVQVGDSLMITFDYSGSLAALINALTDANGNARIAGHVLDCNGGNSCATMSTAVVPVPAALPLLLGGLASLGFVGARRRKA